MRPVGVPEHLAVLEDILVGQVFLEEAHGSGVFRHEVLS
jgi:hypothetical protein